MDQAEKWSLVSVKIAIATAIWYNEIKKARRSSPFSDNFRHDKTNLIVNIVGDSRVLCINYQLLAGTSDPVNKLFSGIHSILLIDRSGSFHMI